MAEVVAMRNNGLPYPIYGVSFTVVAPLLDADGDPISPSSPDSEVSKNGDTFADCTNEATEIATSSGIVYLTLTSTEMTADIVTVRIQSTGAKTTVLTLYPRKLPVLSTGTCQGSNDTGDIQLASGDSAIDDYYNGCLCVAVIDGTTEARIINDYVGSTKVGEVSPAWNTAQPDSNDTYTIYLPEGRQVQQANTTHWNALPTVALPLIPTTAGRTLDVSAGGEAGVDWANVGSPTTAVDLSGTTIKTTQKVDVDTIKTQTVTCSAGVTVSPYLGSTGAAINGTNANTLSSHDPGATIGTSTLTQTQVTGGAYALNSSSFAFNSGLDFTTTQKASITAAVPTASGIADAVCDEDITTHLASASSVATYIYNTNRAVRATGSGVNDASATTTEFNTTLTEADDFWNDSLLLFTSGALAGQTKPILDFANTNGRITLAEATTSAPANGVSFDIIHTHVHPVTQIASAVRTELTTELARIDVATSTRMASYTQPTGFLAATFPTSVGDATAANQSTIAGYIDTEVAAILAAVDTEVAAIKAKTDNLPSDPAGLTNLASAHGAGSWATATGFAVAGDAMTLTSAYDAAKTAASATALASLVTTVGVAGAGLTDLGGFSTTAKGQINAEADTALSDAGVTLARMGALTDWIDGGRLDLILDAILADTGTDGVVVADLSAAICNKLADHVRRRTQANVEASANGDTLDLSSQYGAIQQMQESAVSGGTLTVKKTDGTTTLGTKTVTSSSSADPITGIS